MPLSAFACEVIGGIGVDSVVPYLAQLVNLEWMDFVWFGHGMFYIRLCSLLWEDTSTVSTD